MQGLEAVGTPACMARRFINLRLSSFGKSGAEMRILTTWSLRGLIALGLVLAAWAGAAAFIESLAHRAAKDIAANAGAEPADPNIRVRKTTHPEELGRRLTAEVFEAFTASDPDAERSLLLRLRPFLTHASLPDLLRVERGAIETLYLDGYCDSAARVLAFLLRGNGIDARQINLIGFSGQAHSLVRARRGDGSAFLLDPHTGLVPVAEGRLLSAAEIRERLEAGAAAEEVWQPVTEKAAYNSIYDDFSSIRLSEQSAPFEWRVSLDLGDRDRLRLGALDGSDQGTGEAAAAAGLGIYWHYLGHRYDRGWTRVLVPQQRVRITFTLTDTPRKGIITTDTAPRIEGRDIVYEVEAGQPLRFHDGRASIGLRSLNSYIPVDSILVEKRG